MFGISVSGFSKMSSLDALNAFFNIIEFSSCHNILLPTAVLVLESFANATSLNCTSHF